MRNTLGALSVLFLLGCGGGGGSPTQPSQPTFPDVTGTYSSPQFLIGHATVESTGEDLGTYSCAGSITIGSQSGANFSGNQAVRGGGSGTGTFQGRTCTEAGSTITGVLTASGSATFTVSPATDFAPCVFANGDTVYSGSVTHSAISARKTFTVDCANGNSVRRLRYVLQIAAARG